MSASKGATGGRTSEFWEIGMLIYTLIIIVANIKILIISSIHNAITVFCVFGSIAFYYVTFYIFNTLKFDYFSYGIFRM